MNFTFSPEEQTFKEEVHNFFLGNLPAVTEARKEWDAGQGFGPNCWKLLQKIGEKGWLCPTWPKEYGGLNLSFMYRYILMEEMDYFTNIYTTVGAGMAGPVILRQGSEKQKEDFLPRIARGDIEFALGYTEPQAGSDVAAISIRAEDRGDHFLMNGTKLFNTRVHYAQYHWLGARTEATTPKYKGISLFIVDLKTPGIQISPIYTVGGQRTNEVSYENVIIPREGLVGEKNKGIYYIMEALDFERISIASGLKRDFQELVDYARENGLGKFPVIRHKFASLSIEIEAARLLALRVAWLINSGKIPNYEAAMLKMIIAETRQKFVNTAMEIMGPEGMLRGEESGAPLNGKMEWLYRDSLESLVTRGTSEIMRNIIAQRGLGLPRV